ncbi:MAG TPA: iron-sulfur cluster repair di-iron protein [Lacipirellula sp.]
MTAFQVHDTVGHVVARRPSLSRIFEKAGVDYCCGGKRTLAEACRQKGLDADALLAELEQAAAQPEDGALADAAAMTLTQLADHIEHTHHGYLRREFPRLDFLTHKVSSVHGHADPRLRRIHEVFLEFKAELVAHMMKEEQVLFPIIRQLDASDGLPNFHCGSIANPIRQMEREHHSAGDALEQFRALTDEFTPPEWACNTYRAMIDALAELERDMHQHVHKEDNVLFPRALALEADRSEKAAR